MDSRPWTYRISTTKARDQLSKLIANIQDPRSFCVLTRHDKPVVALVPMSALYRLFDHELIDEVVKGGSRRVSFFGRDNGSYLSAREFAEDIQKTQMDRRVEREVLAQAGLEPVPGGELVIEIERPAPEPKNPWWRFW